MSKGTNVTDKSHESGEMDVPAAFECPITLQIMNNPATDVSSGHTFERETIMEWLLRGHRTNPLTRQPLRPSDLVPNKELQKEIVQWKAENGYWDTTHAADEQANSAPIPWYRQKPTNDPPPTTIPFPEMMVTGNVFMQRLLEAQRRDAENRKRIQWNYGRYSSYEQYR